MTTDVRHVAQVFTTDACHVAQVLTSTCSAARSSPFSVCVPAIATLAFMMDGCMPRARKMDVCVRVRLWVLVHTWLDTGRVGAVGEREGGDWRVGTGDCRGREGDWKVGGERHWDKCGSKSK